MPDTLSRQLSHDDIARRFTGCGRAETRAALTRALRAYQKAHCGVYGRYEYTYLPIAAFRQAAVACFPPEKAVRVFESSRTSEEAASRHYVRDLGLYDRAIRAGFLPVFGEGPFTLVAHLPGYAVQSSLVYMARRLIEWYGDAASGFFLEDLEVLERAIHHSTASGTPLLLLGAAFGLLDLVDAHQWVLPPGARVIETGGMKTRRRHITRPALHAQLADGFGIPCAQVWSEYGMCELLSQAYARGGSVYRPPPWMEVTIFDPEKVECPLPAGTPGVIGVIDLANVYTVSAIMTEDLGVERNGGFEVLGRLQQSDLRGCNLLLGNV